jgi:hypothetical protein
LLLPIHEDAANCMAKESWGSDAYSNNPEIFASL